MLIIVQKLFITVGALGTTLMIKHHANPTLPDYLLNIETIAPTSDFFALVSFSTIPLEFYWLIYPTSVKI